MYFDSFQHNDSILRIMTFNIRNSLLDLNSISHSWNTRKKILIETIIQSRPTILGTQEGTLSQLNEIYDVLLDNQYIMLGSNGRLPKGMYQSQLSRDNEFCEIFISHPLFSIIDKGTFSLSETPDHLGSKYSGTSLPRIASWVLLALKDQTQLNTTTWIKEKKTSILFINTHLDHLHRWARQKEIQIIETFIAEMWREYEIYQNQNLLVFVTGDFNENENGQLWHDIVNISLLNDANDNSWNAYQNKGKTEIKLLDCVKEWTQSSKQSLNVPLTFHRWEGLDYIEKDTNGAPIDWILCTPNVLHFMHLLRASVITWNSSILDTTWNASQNGIMFPSDHFPLFLDVAFKTTPSYS